MKIYVAGPITGIPDYKERFAEAEAELKDKGHAVMNPAVLPDGFEHKEYMQICLPMVEVCDAVVFLDGWRDSMGALMEFCHAAYLNKARYYTVEDVPCSR